MGLPLMRLAIAASRSSLFRLLRTRESTSRRPTGRNSRLKSTPQRSGRFKITCA